MLYYVIETNIRGIICLSKTPIKIGIQILTWFIVVNTMLFGVRSIDFSLLASDVMQDHVHLILENNPKVPITRIVGLLKAYIGVRF